MTDFRVIIIGAGLSGLCCGRRLMDRGVDTLILDSAEAVGGRIRTDLVDGFQLDHGFQVLQTAYPEAQVELDYDALKLHPFEPGAIIQSGGKSTKMSDPWRRPGELLRTAFNGVGGFSDRLNLAKLRWHVSSRSMEELWRDPDTTTMEYLRDHCRFSQDIIDRFFRPWFSGVFFEQELATSSRFFKFIFRMFATGDASLPEKGMGAIPQQIADRIPKTNIRLSSPVERVDDRQVTLRSGEKITAEKIVLACDAWQARKLISPDDSVTSSNIPEACGTICYYFSADRAPLRDPILVLNGDKQGPINNISVPSNVASSYAPPGKSLISVSVVGREASAWIERNDWDSLQHAIVAQLQNWYGAAVQDWTMLRRYVIPHALPGQRAHFRDNGWPGSKVSENQYQCGDYCETASIHGAMVSGKKAADAVLSDVGILSNTADV